jgi:hypothetical protein
MVLASDLDSYVVGKGTITESWIPRRNVGLKRMLMYFPLAFSLRKGREINLVVKLCKNQISAAVKHFQIGGGKLKIGSTSK